MKRMQIFEIETSKATEVFSDNSIRSAYPCEVTCNNGKLEMYGLTKREYFAGLAMQALITNVNYSLDSVANLSVEMSDKMLKELDKK
jgi:hypothetical protein